MRKPTVYLAGPIAGCNDDQRRVWRNDLKRGFHDEFDFIDPMDNLLDVEASDFEVVQADAEAIKSADAVLANMWRESIGTAMGVVHAHSVGKIVVVCDPNLIGSRTLGFYADATNRTLPEALASVRTLLRAQTLVLGVEKAGGREEPFDRQKLALSVRKACIAARQSDIVPARAIVVRALDFLLGGTADERLLNSNQIKEAVWEAIAELAADPLHEADYEAIRRAWERHAESKSGVAKASPAASAFVPQVHPQPLEVPIITPGTHSTIWGHRIGADAWPIFVAMRQVEGINQIVLGQFTNTGSPPSKPHVRIQASKTPHVIEGKCFDRGKKGTLQTFQIRVSNPAHRDAVLATLREHLTGLGYIRSIVFSRDD